VKVFLVDDHEVVRRGLAGLLDNTPDLEVVGEAGSVAEAMASIPALRPDVAVLDLRLPDGNGVELCRDLLSEMPDLRCLMLTSCTTDEAMLDAVLAGASGYLVKDVKGLELVNAIRDVGKGKSLLDSRAAAALMDKLRHGTPEGTCWPNSPIRNARCWRCWARDLPIGRSRRGCCWPRRR